MTVLDIFLIILVLVGIVLGLYLIYFLKGLLSAIDKMVDSVKKIESDVEELKVQIIPIISELEKTTSVTSNLVTKADNYINDLEGVFGKVKGFTSGFFAGKDQSNTTSDSNNSVNNLVKNLTAISKGLTVFWENMKNN